MSYYPQQQQYIPPPTTSGLAVTGFILSTVGVVFGFLGMGLFLCPLGIIFSSVAFPVIDKGRMRGKGLAIAGLTIGVVGLLISILLVAFAASR